MEYYRKIGGRDVWVTVLKPLIWSEQDRTYVESPKYCTAFKFDQPAFAVAGEFLRDDTKSGEFKWFDSPSEAATDAFDAAEQKLSGQ